jgi:hypothetical protein
MGRRVPADGIRREAQHLDCQIHREILRRCSGQVWRSPEDSYPYGRGDFAVQIQTGQTANGCPVLQSYLGFCETVTVFARGSKKIGGHCVITDGLGLQ